MARFRMQFVTLMVFTASIMFLPPTLAQRSGETLKPRTQSLGGGAFKPSAEITTKGAARTLETASGGAPAPFTHLLLRWNATEAAEEGVEFAVRASRDGRDWTAWGALVENPDLHDEQMPDIHWTGVIHTGLARFWQLRVSLNPDPQGTLPVLREVQIDTVDARGSVLPGQGKAAAVSLGAKQLSGQPAFVPRTAWGGSNVIRNSRAPRWRPATHLVVHHSADPNSLRPTEATWTDRVRAEWAFHRYQRGWGDLGYNWVIDPNGVIYEGRNGSSDPTRDAVGVHDAANEGSMSVVLLGTFGPRSRPGAMAPTAAAQAALVRLLAWKAGQRAIDPLGSSVYEGCATSRACLRVHPGGVVGNIVGHREVIPSSSACPGDLAMEVLPSIRGRVAEALLTPEDGKSPLPTDPAEPAAPGDPATEPPPDPGAPPPDAAPTPTPPMPNLVGLGEQQAKEALARLRIYMVVVDYQGRDRLGEIHDQFPPYAVVSHNPPAGAPARAGMLVQLGVRAP